MKDLETGAEPFAIIQWVPVPSRLRSSRDTVPTLHPVPTDLPMQRCPVWKPRVETKSGGLLGGELYIFNPKTKMDHKFIFKPREQDHETNQLKGKKHFCCQVTTGESKIPPGQGSWGGPPNSCLDHYGLVLLGFFGTSFTTVKNQESRWADI